MKQYNKVLDSGERQVFSTGSRRDTEKGKGRPDLIPVWPQIRLARHYQNGAEKYGDRNWESGQPMTRYWSSAWRHLMKYKAGCRKEDHLAAVAWNIFAIIDHEERIARGLLPAELNDFPDPVILENETLDLIDALAENGFFAQESNTKVSKKKSTAKKRRRKSKQVLDFDGHPVYNTPSRKKRKG